MKEFKSFILILLIAISLNSCVSIKKNQMEFINNIDLVYYQKNREFVNQSNSRIDFHILFKEPFSPEILLQKIHFRNQKSVVGMVNEKEYIAQFFQPIVQQDLILDSDTKKEYGNVAPILKNSKLESNPNEAVLEYKMKNKTYFFKLRNVQERQ